MVYFVFRRKAGGGLTKMLTVVCFVFRGKVEGGIDEDADSGMLCVQGKSGRRQ